MIITIGGNVGAGKTTLAQALSKAIGYEEIYIGGIMREMAKEEGISIEAFYQNLKNDPTRERTIDERQAVAMREKTDLIIQGRVSWFFAKQSPNPSFNIFLAVEPKVGAERAAQRPEYRDGKVEEILKLNTEREKVELQRYKNLYHIENFLDSKHYDFVLDTSHLTEKEVLEKILAALPK